MKARITDIHCTQCGAPAAFDIRRQLYLCSYCGGTVEPGEAVREKEGFRKMQADRIRNEVAQYRLVKTSCSGCGAEVVLEEGEALGSCAFCGRSLVRSKYLKSRGLPEYIIPFRLTEEEAKKALSAWCEENGQKAEAKSLKPLIGELAGYYLPYELVRGPVHMTTVRMDGGGRYPCEGYLDDIFVNRSKQLDNLLLDGMEPFDTEDMAAFDCSMIAGQRVKTSDLDDKVLEGRVREETQESYAPAVRKVLETKAVDVQADVKNTLRLPVLLPVYYISRGNVLAAVNGQTGKVSVRAEKASHYYFLPWWFKAILATAAAFLLICGGLHLGGMTLRESLVISGMAGFVLLIVMLCMYSDTTKNRFSVEAGYKIFTSGEKGYVRDETGVLRENRIPERRNAEPMFFRKLDGVLRQVVYRFTTPGRVFKMAALAFIALFLPVIVALFLNGFNFRGLNLAGSAAWFCIAVPIVPVYVVKFGIVDLYERPLVYTIDENGTKKRWRKRTEPIDKKGTILAVLRALIIPPVSLAVWFGIASFLAMCYLTAFGFGD